jgi:hypothetical protein
MSLPYVCTARNYSWLQRSRAVMRFCEWLQDIAHLTTFVQARKDV